MIFVDTGGWFARVAQRDDHHAAARRWFDANRAALATTDLVAIETINLFAARFPDAHGRRLGLRVGRELLDGNAILLIRVSSDDLAEALSVFERFADKRWSFTDCTSFAVMRRLGLREALSFDRNFDQMPGIRRVPG